MSTYHRVKRASRAAGSTTIARRPICTATHPHKYATLPACTWPHHAAAGNACARACDASVTARPSCNGGAYPYKAVAPLPLVAESIVACAYLGTNRRRVAGRAEMQLAHLLRGGDDHLQVPASEYLIADSTEELAPTVHKLSEWSTSAAEAEVLSAPRSARCTQNVGAVYPARWLAHAAA